MMKSTLAALQPSLSNARLTRDAAFDGASTDSRAVAPGNLFIALRGERFDANDFLPDVAARGVAAVVAERLPDGFTLPALVVPDARVALGEIGRFWRTQFAIPVIGVTGSNGKTTVKEMIASILNAAFGDEYLATRGNLNNEVGVPLTLFRLNAQCRAAVIELGMNHPGEIGILSSIALPTVGLVNNAQREHQEFMESVEAVAKENGSVIRSLPEDGVAVYPADDEYTALWQGYAAEKSRRSITFGLTDSADVRCTYRPNDFGSDLRVTALRQDFDVQLSAAGVHNVRNALAAIACSLAAGISMEAICKGLEAFAPVNGRLQRKKAVNGALVIDDTYNANPDSVRAAIDVLANMPSPRLLVLGDMGEVGDDGPEFHAEVGQYAKSRGIDHLFTLGELASHSTSAFGSGAAHFTDAGVLGNEVEKALPAGATVLVKGSRFMKMERIVQHLIGQSPQETH
ncbi:MAG: murF [Paucimonas sp.]|jgi:UDP-N-acetylmuramoyl-tripeptide--D-alanyl-D-alanine ligase|nr:murF [Paucimonas sp.]